MDNIDTNAKNFLNGLHDDIECSELICHFLISLTDNLIEEKKEGDVLFSSTLYQKAYRDAYNIVLNAIPYYLKENLDYDR